MRFLLLFFFLSLSAQASFLPDSFSSKFEQIEKSAISGKTKKSQGTLEYRYPGQIRFEFTGNNAMTYVHSGNVTYHYRPPFIEGEKGELTIYKGDKGKLGSFFDSLKQGLTSNKRYDVKKMNGGAELIFKNEFKESLEIEKAFLSFDGSSKYKNIKEIKLVQKNNKTVTLKILEMNLNGVSKSRFKFDPPENTEVNRLKAQ